MGNMTDFNSPDNLSGGALGAVSTLTIYGGDMIAAQTNLVLGAFKCPFALIPLSLEIMNRSIAGGTPTVGLYDSTATADVFANANTGATGVPVRNSTVAGTAPAVIPKDNIIQLRGTTGGGVTAVGIQAILTYLSTGVPTNRTD